MRTHRPAPLRRRFRSLYLWHRYFGLTAAVLVLLLAFTGVVIQHAPEMGLDRQHVANRLLLRGYGITPDPVVSYQTERHWISHAGDTLYIDNQPVEGHHANLRGAVDAGVLIAVISGDSVLLLSREGELVEQLEPGSGLPEAVLGIARAQEGVVLRGLSRYWRPDEDWLQWQPHTGPHPRWVEPREAPAELTASIQRHNLANEISWERLLLDLHSGRLFGEFGIYLMDLAAIAMVWLAGSGIWLWLQRRPHKQK